ncbi:hypothetical protein P8452_22874 [Trifolium repens]|nr:exosome complex exonuclease RRP44 protein A [Trifolium repens]WJX34798.1 hypothetical protein P8452_22874 [Trifolium repens]
MSSKKKNNRNNTKVGKIISPSCSHILPKPCHKHLSIEEINKAFKVGDLLKGTFRVFHDKAYCKCDGMVVFVDGTVSRNRAIDGDIVAVEVNTEDKTGKVVGIIEKSPRRERVIAFIESRSLEERKLVCGHLELKPMEENLPSVLIHIPTSGLPLFLKTDAILAVGIDKWTEDNLLPEGRILQIFEEGGKLQTQLDALLFQQSFHSSTQDPFLQNLHFDLNSKEIQSRLNLQTLCAVSIGPSTDSASALSVEKSSDGLYKVGVHVSDVSYFLKENENARHIVQKRSRSLYTPLRELPLWPASFSEGVGLRPGVDRLAISVMLHITDAGDVVDWWVGRTVVRSCCRISYEQAHDINFENNDPEVHGHDVINTVKNLYEISQVLKHKRFTDGSCLHKPKIDFMFDENEEPSAIMFPERKESYSFVKEFMILANKTVAEIICRAYPKKALLRRQPEPNLQKLEKFMEILRKLGLEFSISSSRKFHQDLMQIKEKLKHDPVLYDILIFHFTDALQLPSYFCSGDLKDREWGHYTLAVPFYTHFTSPLQRYADIIVHQILHAALDAEEMYMKFQKNKGVGELQQKNIFTGFNFDKDAAESKPGQIALNSAFIRSNFQEAEPVADIASYCNKMTLASKKVMDVFESICLRKFLSNKKTVLFSNARVLEVGPRFMTIYIEKLAVEQRIYYYDVEGLIVEWLELTSTAILSMDSSYKPPCPDGPNKRRGTLEEVIYFSKPPCLHDDGDATPAEFESAFFPLIVRFLADIPVVVLPQSGRGLKLCVGWQCCSYLDVE